MKVRYILVIIFSIAVIILTNINTHSAQRAKEQELLPVIDMHAHALGGSYENPSSANAEMLFKETYEQFRKCNVVKAVVSGPLELVELWKSKDQDNRIIRGILCHAPDDGGMNVKRFESLVKDGTIEVYGEIVPPLSGTTISDQEWQPYLKICEQYDIPVAIHTGGALSAVDGTWTSKSRLHLGDPYLIEDVVVKYPKLRIYMCHSGQEFHEHVLMLMKSYSRLYTDLGYVLWGKPLSKRYAREFLIKAKEAGYLDRVMFGSDQQRGPHRIAMSIEYLNSLDFLTEKDKRDILYNNAARFLRLEE